MRRRRLGPAPGPRTAPRLVALCAALIATACVPPDDTRVVPRSTMFVGVDVSGSFQKDGRYDDAVAFAGRYIHAHLTGAGDLEQPRALFVGAIGGERPGEPQAFRPIHDFEGKSAEQIERDLREWFPPDHDFTDFNAFFRRAATLVKRQNLALAPVTLVLLTDGVPDVGVGRVAEPADRYAAVDLDPLEYLARNVTVRVLYPDPTVAVHWERDVPRERVRMWTVDAVVMQGWRAQFHDESAEGPSPAELAEASGSPDGGEAATGDAGVAQGRRAGNAVDGADAPTRPTDQPLLWRWIHDNVDYRVRRTVL